MIRDFMLGFPPVLDALMPIERPSQRTPMRPRLTAAEQAARRAIDVEQPVRQRQVSPMELEKSRNVEEYIYRYGRKTGRLYRMKNEIVEYQQGDSWRRSKYTDLGPFMFLESTMPTKPPR